jgi:hypothetical protein
MCGVDVGFDDPSEISTLHASVRQAMMTLDELPPRVHLVTHAGDRGKHNVGRLFFEWIAPVAPADAP